jgi:hypothetical protein
MLNSVSESKTEKGLEMERIYFWNNGIICYLGATSGFQQKSLWRTKMILILLMNKIN